MRINTDVSDLFFNTDLSVTETYDGTGKFTGYDETKLRDEAEIFLNSLSRLGVEVPPLDDLIADFRARL